MQVGVPKDFYITCRGSMASMSGDFGHNRLSSLGDFLQLSVVCNELLPPQSQDVWSTDVFSLLTADIQDVSLFCVSINLFFSHMQTNISGNNLVSSRILHFVLQRVLLIWNPRTIQKALTVKQEVLELLINTKGRQYKKKDKLGKNPGAVISFTCTCPCYFQMTRL